MELSNNVLCMSPVTRWSSYHSCFCSCPSSDRIVRKQLFNTGGQSFFSSQPGVGVGEGGVAFFFRPKFQPFLNYYEVILQIYSILRYMLYLYIFVQRMHSQGSWKGDYVFVHVTHSIVQHSTPDSIKLLLPKLLHKLKERPSWLFLQWLHLLVIW